MQEVTYEFDVKRDIDFVFNNIYKEDVFRKWSGALIEGLHYEGEIIEGTEVEFLDGKENGVGGEVAHIVPDEYIEFILEYEMQDGEVEPLPEARIEAYYFSSNEDGSTHVKIKVTAFDLEFIDKMNDMWAKAIEKIIIVLEAL